MASGNSGVKVNSLKEWQKPPEIVGGNVKSAKKLFESMQNDSNGKKKPKGS